MKRHKGCRTRGFTLIEVVVTTLVMALVALALSIGTQSAIKAYDTSLFVSEGDLLANNLETALGDVLHFAAYKETKEGVIHFNNADYGVADGFLFLDNGVLYLSTQGSMTTELAPLINHGSYSQQKIHAFTLQYDEAHKLFSGNYVLQDKSRENWKMERSFFFRTLNEPVLVPNTP